MSYVHEIAAQQRHPSGVSGVDSALWCERPLVSIQGELHFWIPPFPWRYSRNLNSLVGRVFPLNVSLCHCQLTYMEYMDSIHVELGLI